MIIFDQIDNGVGIKPSGERLHTDQDLSLFQTINHNEGWR